MHPGDEFIVLTAQICLDASLFYPQDLDAWNGYHVAANDDSRFPNPPREAPHTFRACQRYTP